MILLILYIFVTGIMTGTYAYEGNKEKKWILCYFIGLAIGWFCIPFKIGQFIYYYDNN